MEQLCQSLLEDILIEIKTFLERLSADSGDWLASIATELKKIKELIIKVMENA
jgi:hypothetical protein